MSPAEDSDGFLHSFFWVLELFMADGASSLVKNIYFSAPFSSDGTYSTTFSLFSSLCSVKAKLRKVTDLYLNLVRICFYLVNFMSF